MAGKVDTVLYLGALTFVRPNDLETLASARSAPDNGSRHAILAKINLPWILEEVYVAKTVTTLMSGGSTVTEADVRKSLEDAVLFHDVHRRNGDELKLTYMGIKKYAALPLGGRGQSLAA